MSTEVCETLSLSRCSHELETTGQAPEHVAGSASTRGLGRLGRGLFSTVALTAGVVFGLAAPSAADVPTPEDYAASAATEAAGGYDPNPGGFGNDDDNDANGAANDDHDDPVPVISPPPVIQGSLQPGLVPGGAAANDEVIPIRKQDAGECSFRDAHKNNGWGWNPVTRQSCR